MVSGSLDLGFEGVFRVDGPGTLFDDSILLSYIA